MKHLGELLRSAGDDGGVEAEEQAAERADNDAPDEQGVKFGLQVASRSSRTRLWLIILKGSGTKLPRGLKPAQEDKNNALRRGPDPPQFAQKQRESGAPVEGPLYPSPPILSKETLLSSSTRSTRPVRCRWDRRSGSVCLRENRKSRGQSCRPRLSPWRRRHRAIPRR